MRVALGLALAAASCVLTAHEAGAQIAKPPHRLNPDGTTTSTQAIVTVQRDGRLFVEDAEVSDGDLASTLRQNLVPDGRIFVRGDGRVGHARVMEIVELLRDAGFTRVALAAMRSWQ